MRFLTCQNQSCVRCVPARISTVAVRSWVSIPPEAGWSRGAGRGRRPLRYCQRQGGRGEPAHGPGGCHLPGGHPLHAASASFLGRIAPSASRTRKRSVQGWVLPDSRVLEHAAREERSAICLICEDPWPPARSARLGDHLCLTERGTPARGILSEWRVGYGHLEAPVREAAHRVKA
jgi:putative hemolysin